MCSLVCPMCRNHERSCSFKPTFPHSPMERVAFCCAPIAQCFRVQRVFLCVYLSTFPCHTRVATGKPDKHPLPRSFVALLSVFLTDVLFSVWCTGHPHRRVGRGKVGASRCSGASCHPSPPSQATMPTCSRWERCEPCKCSLFTPVRGGQRYEPC